MSGVDPCKIGIMHPAFRVGKVKLINWINEDFELDYKKVEDCATGAVYVLMLDKIYMGAYKKKLKKVNWSARSTHEYTANWKIVQAIFAKEDISKPLDIVKLCNAKFQDNLEFLQWFKFFHDTKCNLDVPYDALKARTGKKSKRKPQSRRTPDDVKSTTKAKKKVVKKKKQKKPVRDVVADDAEDEETKLQLTLAAVTKERDFYFCKLREIEILAQDKDKAEPIKEFKAAILKIMYKTDDGDELDDGGEEADDSPVDDDAYSNDDDNATF